MTDTDTKLSNSPQTDQYDSEIQELRPDVKQLVLNTEGGLQKWKNAKSSYSRLTFVIQNECRVCDCSSDKTEEIKTDNLLGRYHLYGWIYCKDCEPFVRLAVIEKELIVNHLFRYTYMWLDKIPLQFWRRSRSDPTKPSYMEQGASIAPDDFDVISEHHERVVCNVQWSGKLPNTTTTMPLIKSVPLANIICFNRHILGYHISECPFIQKCNMKNEPEWIERWIKKFKYEYDVAAAWDTMQLVLNRITRLPYECYPIILDYYGDIYHM